MTDLALTIPANPGIRELTDIEIDQVEGGILPLFAAMVGIGTALGAGAALINQLTDNKPGVDWGVVAAGAVLGTAAGLMAGGFGAVGMRVTGAAAAGTTSLLGGFIK